MGDDMQTITEQAAKDARDVFESYGSKAREAIDYMEQLIYAATRKTERALPAASAEDVRAEALREAAKAAQNAEITLPLGVGMADGAAISQRQIVAAILNLIPEAKP